jgi:hypothetical protein
VPADMRTYQNEHNMLPNFPSMSEFFYCKLVKLATMHIDAVYNLKLKKT